MAATIRTRAAPATFAELWHRLGDVPLERIPMRPYPGTATVKDVVNALEAADKHLYELVDGVLVEKAMGLRESVYAGRIIGRMEPFAREHDRGFVTTGDGPLEILQDLVRIPDIAFVSWDDWPGEELPEDPVPPLVPRLAIEIISRGNTPKEMARKLRDYFEAGVQLVWFIYPKTQTAEVWTSPIAVKRLGKNQSLDGAEVLPGFKLPLKDVFAPARGRRRGK